MRAGLVWSIIVHWQVRCPLRALAGGLRQSSLERTLLAWCRAHTQVRPAPGRRRGFRSVLRRSETVLSVSAAGLRGRGRARLHGVVAGRAGAERAAAPLAARAVRLGGAGRARAALAPRPRLRAGARLPGHRAPAGPRGCVPPRALRPAPPRPRAPAPPLIRSLLQTWTRPTRTRSRS